MAAARTDAPADVPAAVRVLRQRRRPKLTVIPQAEARRFRPSEVVDFVIVGSGAAGGIIAKELSTAGYSVVVLEQGPRLTEAQFEHDEFGTFMQASYSNSPTTQPQTFRPTVKDKARKNRTL